VLNDFGISDKDEESEIIFLLENTPQLTFVKMRMLLERAISFIYEKEIGQAKNRKTLHDKIKELSKAGTFPSLFPIYLDTIRFLGNKGVHEGLGTRKDVAASLPIFLIIMEWAIERVKRYA